MRKLFNDQAGFVISAELVLVMTIAVLAMVVGLSAVRDAISNEMNDISAAFGAVDQTYYSVGVYKPKDGGNKSHAFISGFGFNDKADDCDCKPILYHEVCGKQDSSQGGKEDGSNP